ncbi:MAG: hypothetical protein ACI8XB_002972 [Patiriisocius sp.]
MHGKPEIHNPDQGSQYTSGEYIKTLKNHGIQISMDGKAELWMIFISNDFGDQSNKKKSTLTLQTAV